MPDPAPVQAPEAAPVATPAPSAASVLASVFDPKALNDAVFSMPQASVPEPVPTPTPEPVVAPKPEPVATPAPDAPTPEVTPTPEPEPDPDVAPEPEGNPEPNADPEGDVDPDAPAARERILPNRIPTAQFDPLEQEAMALRHDLAKQGQKITLKEAIERVELKYVGVPTQAAEPVPAGPSPVEALETEVAALQDQIAQAAEGETLYTPELARLNSELVRKSTELAVARMGERSANESFRQARISAREQVKATVLQEAPNAGDPETYLGSAVSAVISEIQTTPNHPDREALALDSAPRFVVDKALNRIAPRYAKDNGITVEQAKALLRGGAPKAAPKAEAPAPVSSAPAPVPRTHPVTAPGSKTTPEPGPAPTEQQVLAETLKNPKLAEDYLGLGGQILAFG